MYRIRFTTLTLLVAVLALSGWLPLHSAEIRQHAVQDSKTVILVRHAEKCTEPASDPGLTTLGQERAQALRRTLVDLSIEAIYSTPYERTLQTVQGLAEDQDFLRYTIAATLYHRGILTGRSARLLTGDSRRRFEEKMAAYGYPLAGSDPVEITTELEA